LLTGAAWELCWTGGSFGVEEDGTGAGSGVGVGAGVGVGVFGETVGTAAAGEVVCATSDNAGAIVGTTRSIIGLENLSRVSGREHYLLLV